MNEKSQQEAENLEMFGNVGPAPFDLSGIAGLDEMGLHGHGTVRPSTDAERFIHIYADVNDLPEWELYAHHGDDLDAACDAIDPNWRRYFDGGWNEQTETDGH